MMSLAHALSVATVFSIASFISPAHGSATERGFRFVSIRDSAVRVLNRKGTDTVDFSNALFQDGQRNHDIDDSKPHCITRYANGVSALEESPRERTSEYKFLSIISDYSTNALRENWVVKFKLTPIKPASSLQDLEVDCFGHATSGLEELTIKEFESIFGEYIEFSELRIYNRPERPAAWTGTQITPKALRDHVYIDVRQDIASNEFSRILRFQDGKQLSDADVIKEDAPICFLGNERSYEFAIRAGTKLYIKAVSRHFHTSVTEDEAKFIVSQPAYLMELSADIDGKPVTFNMSCRNASLRDPPDFPELQSTSGSVLAWTWYEAR